LSSLPELVQTLDGWQGQMKNIKSSLKKMNVFVSKAGNKNISLCPNPKGKTDFQQFHPPAGG
jgi:hypothetical protein